MKELRVNDQYMVCWCKAGDKILVEIHDFHNLCFFRDYFKTNELDSIKLNPQDYI